MIADTDNSVSFSMQVKSELDKCIPKARHCLIAELLGIVFCCGYFEYENNRQIMVLETESETVLRKCFTILEKAFNIGSMWLNTSNTHTLRLDGNNGLDDMTFALKIPRMENGDFGDVRADERLLKLACCRKSFIRGCFLAAGSISAPEKGYHWEIAITSQKKAESILKVLESLGIDAKQTVRKKYYIVYIKESDQIADVLSLMGAVNARMSFENVRIIKNVRNTVNRKVNCEAANLNKTVSAAYAQIEAIRYLDNNGGLEFLPESLKQAAYLRLSMPHASLAEIGKSLDPPVSKSGANHRLNKIKEIADEVKEKKEEKNDN